MAFATYLCAMFALSLVIVVFLEVKDIQRTLSVILKKLSSIEKKLKENDDG